MVADRRMATEHPVIPQGQYHAHNTDRLKE
jgi:hypothetical protein